MFPPPSITRAMAIEALDQAGLAWRIVCTCGGLTGLRAAAMAGFGLMVQPESMVPAGLVEIRSHQLPLLGEIEFVVAGGSRTLKGPAAELAKVILTSDYRLGRAS
jgi:DNA-binding transcriptional LysR family regulator